jgi:hypothetical protein
MAKNKKPYFSNINGDSQAITLNTEGVFSETTDSITSPIDIYIKRNKILMRKIGSFERAGLLNANEEDDRDIYNLFLLGFVSNVESYFRSIIRAVITFDSHAYNTCLEIPLTYAAALYHDRDLLPEALMENHTFISKKNILSAFTDFLKINVNVQETKGKEVVECLELFELLCQLRHCIVHRAGLLGSKNAIKLGIEEHKSFFEKPINLNLTFLQSANIVCLNCVRTSNTYLYNKLIHRHVTNNEVQWLYPSDRSWYLKYHKLFLSNELNTSLIVNGIIPDTPFESYDKLRTSLSESA